MTNTDRTNAIAQEKKTKALISAGPDSEMSLPGGGGGGGALEAEVLNRAAKTARR